MQKIHAAPHQLQLIASEMDEAASWYQRAINGRDPFALVLASTPLFREFRGTSHWRRLASMMMPIG